MIITAILAALLAVLLLWQAARRRHKTGLPPGRVVYTDTSQWGEVTKPLYDSVYGLTGKPDYIVVKDGKRIPVEVKSSVAPRQPYEGHVFQLAAYCLLIERASGIRPPHGILHYRDNTYAIDYTAELEARLVELLVEIRQCESRKAPKRSHDEPARCARCGYRSVCDERITADI